MTAEQFCATPLSIAAYDRKQVYAIIRDWTVQYLAQQVRSGFAGERLTPEEARELEQLLTAWEQRALGAMPLRDALMVDERRGRRVFALLCKVHTVTRTPVQPGPSTTPATTPRALDPDDLPAELRTLPSLTGLAQEAKHQGLALTVQRQPDEFPFPDDLETLLAPPPRPPQEDFEQPTGWRRRIAMLLAVSGVLMLALPLLSGHIPQRPAGVPLALLTLALLIGIRAGWAGYGGAFCMWLVANLPGFHHGTPLHSLWPAFPLLAIGLTLLAADRRVRAVWRWLRRR